MSKWKLVKLDFKNNPAHFGELGIGMEETSERVRSDTLFSAWVIAYARLGLKIDDLLKRFQEDKEPPFRLSSTFIYRETGRNSSVYYLPKPLKFPIGYPENDTKFAKEYKNLKFLPLSIWQRWYQGDGFLVSDCEELIDKAKSNSKNLKNAHAFSYGETFKFQKQPKVAIDRLNRSTNLYHTAFVRYYSEENNKSGLYFLIEINDFTLENDLKASLSLLGEDGLGGERSSGAGRFESSWHDLDEQDKKWKEILFFENNRHYHSLISLYWDRKLVDLDKSSYDLQERGGWIASPFSGKQQRRKTVRMFTEGSTFIDKPNGSLADVTPRDFQGKQLSDHEIYRSGIALSIPIKLLGD